MNNNELELFVDTDLFRGDIVENTVFTMFAYFKSFIEKQHTHEIKKRELVKQFERIMSNFKTLQSPINSVYREDSLERLISLADATNLKDNFEELVIKFLKFVEREKLIIKINNSPMDILKTPQKIDKINNKIRKLFNFDEITVKVLES